MSDKALTPKGTRQADAVLDAAIACLGREGYAGTSLQRVADAAGVNKRMVVYYFGSREQLMAAALERVAGRMLDDLERRLAELDEPDAVVEAVLDAVWDQVADRAMLGAYFGLVAESASDDVLRATLDALRDRAHAVAHAAIDRLEAHGHRLSMERELLILAVTVTAHGIGMEILERGVTPQLERGIALARVSAPLWVFE